MALQSVAESLAQLPSEQREEALSLLNNDEALSLMHDWRGFMARQNQIAPDGDWDIWLALAGRGFGKTRMGSEWIRERVNSGSRRIALIAETQKDLEEVLIEGESGILAVFPDNERPTYRKKPVKLVFPSGAIALGYNGTEPNQLRGPQFDTAWCDELAKWRYARKAWDMLRFTMRLGSNPRTMVTTTPRPIQVIKAIVSGVEGKVEITRGKTSDNKANLAKGFYEGLVKTHGGTRLGRQELDGEILGDMPGAIWRIDQIDLYRKTERPELSRIVVAVDPAVTNTENSDYHGIIVAGLAKDGTGCVLEDGSLQGSPLNWARRAIALFDKWQADSIVVEVNQGGDMVKHTLESVRVGIPVTEVRATRGKHVRAEPIAALYEQGRVSHLGDFPELETEMSMFTVAGYEGENSPDRTDALVWAMTELFPDISMGERKPKKRKRQTSNGWMG